MRLGSVAVLMALLAAVLIVFGCTSAQAQAFENHIPSYGLYCADSEAIQNASVTFDLTDTELLTQGKGIERAEYTVKGNKEVDFVIPFISSALDVPSFVVKANGQEISGSVWYGDVLSLVDKRFDIENLYSPYLDDSFTGTLYKVVPNNDTITIELSFNAGEVTSFIYETSSNFTSTYSADGKRAWTFKNALEKSEYDFFVMGDATTHAFCVSSSYTAQSISCKEYIDSQYEELREYFDEVNEPVEFCYSIFNKALKQNAGIRFDDLFFNSVSESRVNGYKFSLSPNAGTVVSYELPVNVQSNFNYDPPIYTAAQKHIGHCPVSYTIKLCDEMPYIVECSASTMKEGAVYTATTTQDFHFVFSSSQKPTDVFATGNKKPNVAIIISVVCACAIIILGITVAVVYVKKR